MSAASAVIILLIALLINGGLAFIPGRIAKDKGYSFGGYWCLSFFLSFLVGIITTACIPDRNQGQNAAVQQTGQELYCRKCGEALANHPANESSQMAAVTPGAQFLRNHLGFIVTGALLFAYIAIGVNYTDHFLSPSNLMNMLRQFCGIGMIALGVAASSRLRGPDFSMASVMGLASVIAAAVVNAGLFAEGAVVTILVCWFIGLTSGAVISFLRAPAVIVTLMMSLLVRAIAYTASDGMPVVLNQRFMDPHILTYAFLPLCAVIAFLALLLAGRLTPLRATLSGGAARSAMEMLGYGFTAIIAGLAGFAFTFRLNSAQPTLGIGFEALILLVFVAIQSSSLLDHGLAALGYSLAVALLWTVLGNVSSLVGLSPYIHTIQQSILVFILLCIACFVRGGVRQALLPGGRHQSLLDINH